MSTEHTIHDTVEQAAATVGPVWPLHSFVTANPLAGFEDRPFHEAVERAEQLFGGEGYPDAAVFRAAWESGRIDADLLTEQLAEHGYDSDPETLLSGMAADESTGDDPDRSWSDRVDALLTKWLAAFLDQETAEWPMPDRERGFYRAFCEVARHDRAIPDRRAIADLPDDPVETIEQVLSSHPAKSRRSVFRYHLAALPGWTGYIRRRADDGGEWQSTYPITLVGYLAVRLALVDLLDAPVEPPGDVAEADETGDADDGPPLEALWLSAWEESYRQDLVGAVTTESAIAAGREEIGRPDAQFVFCIDTRSEILRRHIERTGDYDTHGYAGFFGIPMRYRGYDSDVTVDACPPILDAQHRVEDRPVGSTERRESRDRWTRGLTAGGDLLGSLKSNAATAFSFVESAGVGYGLGLVGRTLLPASVYDLLETTHEQVPSAHEFCEPALDHRPNSGQTLPTGLSLEQRVEYAATAFDLMGWQQFARVVVFAGHAAQTANNPFESSLDCGACAGNPGGPSARVLATICNDDAVRARLRDRGFEIPADTVFVAGEHNTTTDAVELYTEELPESHEDDIERLREDLATARAGAAAERAGDMGAGTDSGVRETERRAADWAETRPEWGLAGNAAFVVGPRTLTEGLDLDGRSFLHSYDWSTDPDGESLAAIVAGPMVVTQWINTQYYFATVDTAVYGSGSKVTHNPVGNVGVYQGNGGDLVTGLPVQSLMSTDDQPYHQPLRLTTVIQAPVERVTDILAQQEQMSTLLDNGWLSLTVVDPEQDHRAFHYDGSLTWRPASEATDPAIEESATSPPVTDD